MGEKFEELPMTDSGGAMDSCFSLVRRELKEGQEPDPETLLRLFEEKESLKIIGPRAKERRQAILSGGVFNGWLSSIKESARAYRKYEKKEISQEEMNEIDRGREKWRLKLKAELLQP